MHNLNRIIESGAVWLARLGGLMVALIGLLVTIDVISRNLFGHMAVHSLEFSTYLFAAAIAFGMAYAATTGAHIRIDVVSARMPAPVRRGLDLLALVVLAALALFFLWKAIELTGESFRRGITSNSALAVPQAYPQTLWLIGLAGFAVTTILMAIRLAMLLATGRYREADRVASLGSPEQEVHEALEEVGGRRI